MCHNIFVIGQVNPFQKDQIRNMWPGSRFFHVREAIQEKILQGQFLENLASGDPQFLDSEEKTEKILLADGNILVVTIRVEDSVLENLLKKNGFAIYFLSLVVPPPGLQQVYLSNKERLSYSNI